VTNIDFDSLFNLFDGEHSHAGIPFLQNSHFQVFATLLNHFQEGCHRQFDGGAFVSRRLRIVVLTTNKESF
jgi:hypothetical protein